MTRAINSPDRQMAEKESKAAIGIAGGVASPSLRSAGVGVFMWHHQTAVSGRVRRRVVMVCAAVFDRIAVALVLGF
jgi:hypothetical protein